MLTLYDNPGSSNALKVRMLLAELGLDYQRAHVPFPRPRPEALLAVYPFGSIPALVDGDLRLGESNAILRYLAAREDRDDLYPADLRQRARVDQALDAWQTMVRPAAGKLDGLALLWTNREQGGGRWEDAPDQEALQEAIPAVVQAYDNFERLLPGEGYVCGTFTIADCCVAPGLWRTHRLPLPTERWPKLMRVRQLVTEHPSFKAAGPVE